MKKIIEMISVNGKINSKLFLTVFIFTPAFIIGMFTGINVNALYVVAGLIASSLGISEINKKSNNNIKKG